MGVITERETLTADAVIIATGGLSYPGTGSTGDGYQWARQSGHRIIKPRPGLVPLLVKEPWVRDLQGLTLKNVKAAAFTAAGKKINEEFGELLFTHFGLSGPIILSMSRDIENILTKANRNFQLDLKPALSEEKLEKRVQRDFDKYARKMFKNGLNDLLPKKMIPVIIQLCGIDPEKECSQIDRQERLGLVQLLKNLAMTVYDTRPVAGYCDCRGGGCQRSRPEDHAIETVPGSVLCGRNPGCGRVYGGLQSTGGFFYRLCGGKVCSCRLISFMLGLPHSRIELFFIICIHQRVSAVSIFIAGSGSPL